MLALKVTFNKKTYGSEYKAEILEDSLKADYNFDFPNNSITLVSDMTKAATKVDKYFSEDVEQVNCEMKQINRAVKYGFGMFENTRSTIAVDDNGLLIK